MHSFHDPRSPARRAMSRLGLAASVLLAGCGGGNDSGPRDGVLAAPACDGTDLSGVRSAVHVSTQGDDAGGCGGSAANACLTIQRGIDLCAGSGCAVLVRHGLYPTSATIQLRDGVGVYGGCRFDGDPQRGYRTTIEANPAPGTPAIAGSAIHTPTVVHGLVVVGKNETAPGTASIVMTLANSQGLVLTRSVLIAGRGGYGAAVGPPPPGSAHSGGAGDTRSYTAGGQGPGGPSCDAGGTAGRGGDGSARRQNTVSDCGFFSCNCNESGGLKGSDGADSGWASGGSGGSSGTQGNACWEGVIRQSVGGQGSTGRPGSAGACSPHGGVASADVWGGFQGASWLPGVGGAGGSGDVGSGGGGGGPGGMCTLLTADTPRQWFPYWGQPGGGGGAGGCGGPGGPGGQQGGASIGLLLAASSMTIDPTSLAIVGGQGGHGGQGATGGSGGAGGGGGAGGNAGSNCTQYDAIVNIGWGGPGGPGGPGGAGGSGSGGAGGNGGPSVGIALTGGSAEPDAAGVYAGFAGSAGGGDRGGAGDGCSGATGQAGTAGGMATLRRF